MNNSTTQTLEERINTFDCYYMISDDHGVYSEWSRKGTLISLELNEMSEDDKVELASKITSEHALRFFKLYQFLKGAILYASEKYKVTSINSKKLNSIYSYELLEYDSELGFWDEIKHPDAKKPILKQLEIIQ